MKAEQFLDEAPSAEEFLNAEPEPTVVQRLVATPAKNAALFNQGVEESVASMGTSLKRLSDPGVRPNTFREHEREMLRAGVDWSTAEQAGDALNLERQQQRDRLMMPGASLEQAATQEAKDWQEKAAASPGLAIPGVRSAGAMTPVIATAMVPVVGGPAAIAEGGLQTGGDVWNQAYAFYRQTMTEEQSKAKADEVAGTAGLGNAAIFAALPGPANQVATRILGEKLAERPVQQAIARTALAGAQAGAVMAADTVARDIEAAGTYRPDLTAGTIAKEALESAATGAVVGAGLHGPMEAARLAEGPGTLEKSWKKARTKTQTAEEFLKEGAEEPSTAKPGTAAEGEAAQSRKLTAAEQEHVDNVREVIDDEMGEDHGVQVIYDPEHRTPSGAIADAYFEDGKIVVNAAFIAHEGALREALREEQVHSELATPVGQQLLGQFMDRYALDGNQVLELAQRGYLPENGQPTDSYFAWLHDEFIAKQGRKPLGWFADMADRLTVWAKEKMGIALTQEQAARALLRKLATDPQLDVYGRQLRTTEGAPAPRLEPQAAGVERVSPEESARATKVMSREATAAYEPGKLPKPVVPGTPPESLRSVPVLREIRERGANTRKKIQALYPHLKSEEAGRLRRLAFAENNLSAPKDRASGPPTRSRSPDSKADFGDSDLTPDERQGVSRRYSLQPPVPLGKGPGQRWVDSLPEKAREIFNFYRQFQDIEAKLERVPQQAFFIKEGVGKAWQQQKSGPVLNRSLTTAEYNEYLSRNPHIKEAMAEIYNRIDEPTRAQMGLNADGTLSPNLMDKTGLFVYRSFMQRLMDARNTVLHETASSTYKVGDTGATVDIAPPEAGAEVSMPVDERYRQEILLERRRQYEAGEIRQVSSPGAMSFDSWGTMGFTADNTKTMGSGDFTTICPQMFTNNGCWYCYRRAAFESNINNKLGAEKVWYVGEFLRLKPELIAQMNKVGGFRIQSFGDFFSEDAQTRAMIVDMIHDADRVGLQLKIITKDPKMIDFIAQIRDQKIPIIRADGSRGILGDKLFFNLSADYLFEKRGTGDEKLSAQLNPSRPLERHTDPLTGKREIYWKRACTVDEADAISAKHPWVNIRTVATTVEEFCRSLLDPRVHVVTGYHGHVRSLERVSVMDDGGRRVETEVEPIGDLGMPRFNPDGTVAFAGETEPHRKLAFAIAKLGLQKEYERKACCITGKCASCKTLCGAPDSAKYTGGTPFSTQEALTEKAGTIRTVLAEYDAMRLQNRMTGLKGKEAIAALVDDLDHGAYRNSQYFKDHMARLVRERGPLRGPGGERYSLVDDPVLKAAPRFSIVDDVAEGLRRTRLSFQSVFSPQNIDPTSKRFANALRDLNGQQAIALVRSAQKLQEMRDFFDKTPVPAGYKFDPAQPLPTNYAVMVALEQNRAALPTNLQDFARTFDDEFAHRIAEVQSLKPGALQTLIRDYLPHMWQRPTSTGVANLMSEVAARSPLEGSRAFMRQRTLPTVAEGLQRGLVPISDNPVDILLAKMHQMDKFILSARLLQEAKATGMLKFVRLGQKIPDGRRIVDDRVGTVFAPPVDPGGAGPQLVGHWTLPEGAATVLENYLSPGLQRFWAYRTLRAGSNILNAAQLGFSAFHVGFTSGDAIVSSLTTGLTYLAQGKPVKALASGAAATVAPVLNYYAGKAVQARMVDPSSRGVKVFGMGVPLGRTVDDMVGRIAELAVKGGLRAESDPFWKTAITRNLKRAWAEGGLANYAKIGMGLPMAVIEQSVRPIAEFLVPRQKLGVFAQLALQEMDRIGWGAGLDEVRAGMARAADWTEDRMGQMTYDNLFYNRAVKDVALLGFRAYGWQLGKYRHMYGATADTASALNDLVHGKAPEITNRMMYPVALTMAVAMAGGLIHRMLTGKNPEQLEDYIFPQNGQVGPDGRPQRMMLPSYAKDLISDWHDFPSITKMGESFYHKLNPAVAAVVDMWNNRDYYGVQLRNPEDTAARQAIDLGKFAAKQFVPFSITGTMKLSDQNAPVAQLVLPFVGIVPAKRALMMTSAEALSSEIIQGMMPSAPRTRESADHSALLREITQDIRDHPPRGVKLDAALAAGQLKPQDASKVASVLSLSPLQYQIHRMPTGDAMRVWRLANTPERQLLYLQVAGKVGELSRTDPARAASYMQELVRTRPSAGSK